MMTPLTAKQMAKAVFGAFRDKWEFESSSSDKIYTVYLNNDDHLSCDCRGWINLRGSYRDCRHQQEVIRREGFVIDHVGDNHFVYVRKPER